MFTIGQEVVIISKQNKNDDSHKFAGFFGKIVKINSEINPRQYKVDVLDIENYHSHKNIMLSEDELLPVKMASIR